ncbi:CgeB family protein [Corynebacterium minutissimum]
MFAGAAILASQAANFVGAVNLGRSVSRTKQVSESATRESAKTIAVIEELEGRIDRLIASNAELQKQVKALPKEPVKTVIKREPVKTVVKEVVAEPKPSSNPKSRRTGGPANNTVYESVESRKYQPLRGEQAKRWINSRTGGSVFLPDESTPAYRTEAKPFPWEIPVAIIADDFTFHSFQHEFKSFRLTPSNWRGVFEKHKPRMFFCESAWQGGSPDKHPWQGKVYASIRWPKENRSELLEILDYCHRNKIPTVFWNKEDPTHFSDRINDFARTAGLFDYVFTTAEECVESYKKDVGATSVQALPFAVQPKIFNPIGADTESQQVNFAGTWYGMYPERCKAQAMILDQALDADLDLVIYDRMKTSPNPIYRYPERFEQYTKEPIPYEETARAYKQSKFGVTMNTVTDSNTMFARRVFELAACGAVVLSNEALGVRNFFGDSVIYADTEPERLKSLSEEEYRQLQRSALNIALRNTYTQRAEKILETVGLSFQRYTKQPTFVVQVSTNEEFDQFHSRLQSFNDVPQLLVVVKKDSEQSLEFKLLRDRKPGVTVISERSLVEDEYRLRSFVSTPEFVLWETPEHLPSESEIEELQLHNSYFTGQIAFSDQQEELYQVSERFIKPASVVPTSYLKAALTGQKIPTYFV